MLNHVKSCKFHDLIAKTGGKDQNFLFQSPRNIEATNGHRIHLIHLMASALPRRPGHTAKGPSLRSETRGLH